MHPPSPQQQAIIEAIANSTNHLAVEALAGTGKTTTIEMCQEKSSGMNVAFNRIVRETFKQRMPDAVNHTFNSLGHSIITKNLGRRLKFNTDKMKQIRDDLKIRWSDCPDFFRIMDLARGSGFGFTEYAVQDAEDLGAWKQIVEEFDLELKDGFDYSLFPEALKKCWVMASQGEIDYGDQLWYPVVANLSLGLPFEIIYIDEAQDVNTIQIKLIQRYARRSRICLVGDPHQAIYGFRGSVNGSMGVLTDALGADTLPLSVTYRCPKSVVRIAQDHVPEYEAHPSAPEGTVKRLGKGWDYKDLEPGSVVLCRNNAPIIEMALIMISRGIPASVRGREIGKSLVSLAKTIIKQYNPTSRDQFERCLEIWVKNKMSEGRKSEGAIQERASALGALLTGCSDRATLDEIKRKTDRLFTDKDANILLSTIHKAKGLEWKTVYFLNEWMIPSPFAKTDEAVTQEYNVHYVGVTRTMDKLIFIDRGKGA